SSEAHRIRRLRSLGGKPAALEEIWLDGSRAETVAIEELSDSLYLYYRKALGIWILRAEDRVGVGQVPGWAPPEFGLAPGAAAGFIERTGWMQDGASAEFSRTWFDHGVARYVARLR
ncbi:MAG: GntR family transcriptional regulator, partial [Mesorhizobium sp.]